MRSNIGQWLSPVAGRLEKHGVTTSLFSIQGAEDPTLEAFYMAWKNQLVVSKGTRDHKEKTEKVSKRELKTFGMNNLANSNDMDEDNNVGMKVEEAEKSNEGKKPEQAVKTIFIVTIPAGKPKQSSYCSKRS